MAGDWIKIELVTPDKPEIYRIGELLKITPEEALGRLIRFWVWADEQSQSGNILRITDASLDTVTRKVGFAKAMRSVGWLAGVELQTTVPHFARHNGQSAKKRALAARRKVTQRSRSERDMVSRKSHAPSVTKRGQERDQRREEKSIEKRQISLPVVDCNIHVAARGSTEGAAAVRNNGKRMGISSAQIDTLQAQKDNRHKNVAAAYESLRNYRAAHGESEPGVGQLIGWLRTQPEEPRPGEFTDAGQIVRYANADVVIQVENERKHKQEDS